MINPFASSTTLLKDKKKKTKNTILTEPTTVVSENSAPHGESGHVHQSGDDWGMEDLDDYFGTDIMNMDPTSPEFADAVQADTDKGEPTLPGEIVNNWSTDFTDSGFQTDVDLEDTLEEETEEAGYIPGQAQTPLYSIDASGTVSKNSKKREYKGFGGVGRTGGREAKYGRGRMSTGSKKASILAP